MKTDGIIKNNDKERRLKREIKVYRVPSRVKKRNIRM